MKVTLFAAAFTLITLCTFSTAYVTVNPFPDTVEIGKTYELSWTATANYTYTLWLVLDKAGETGYGWTKAGTLFRGLVFDSLEGNYTWTVPSNLNAHGYYGLWLDGFPLRFNGESFSNMTGWFEVSSSSQSANSSSGSATNSPTSTTLVGTSGGASSVPTGGASSGVSSSSHHSSLSGGAIAGIVIGCLVALAIVAVVAFLAVRRRRQAGVKRREAEARANRLAPVMQESSGAFEMNRTMP